MSQVSRLDKLLKLRLLLVELILKIDVIDPNRTRMTITDVQVFPSHTSDKGIFIKGEIIIGVKVEYKDYVFPQAYRILQAELENFTLDEFKERIYQESRIWIKKKAVEIEILDKLKDTKNKTVYLD